MEPVDGGQHEGSAGGRAMTTPTVTKALRPELPPLPDRIKRLPVDARGYPVPWFVTWENGVPEFRIMDGAKFVRAVRERLCWVCGQTLGSFLAFNIGPMCAVNRISAEPPSHRECAEFSAIACPFLSRPHMRRREGGIPAESAGAGVMIKRNPGVALVWVTKRYELVKTEPGPRRVDNTLFQMGDPTDLLCFAEGRAATVEEIRASVDSGYPLLEAEARRGGGAAAVQALEQQAVTARRLLRIA
jgi:hypothetical protein